MMRVLNPMDRYVLAHFKIDSNYPPSTRLYILFWLSPFILAPYMRTWTSTIHSFSIFLCFLSRFGFELIASANRRSIAMHVRELYKREHAFRIACYFHTQIICHTSLRITHNTYGLCNSKKQQSKYTKAQHS